VSASWVVWTSELSPFGLKLVLLCRHAGLPFRVLPRDGGWRENWTYALRRLRLINGRLPLTWPVKTADDEFPLVPYLFGPDGENLYDSTAIAVWLDRGLAPERRLMPAEPAAHFVARLIDDYADEFGLYMVHHNRWKVSALDNDAGRRMAREFAFLFGPVQRGGARWFQRRQTQRLPYLFSVAPDGFRIDGLPRGVQPPSLPGFPPTHDLLEEAFDQLLQILETLLADRPFVLGERLTIADAGIYGQLGMNLSDPSASERMRSRAPRLHGWLQRLHAGDAGLLAVSGPLRVDAALRPLLEEICRVFVPLMQQNRVACEQLKRAGETVFNERAFARGRSLYEGQIDGQPFRAVAKTFQSKVWRERVAEWDALSAAARRNVEALLPAGHGL
jgi:glutathione S-transferase